MKEEKDDDDKVGERVSAAINREAIPGFLKAATKIALTGRPKSYFSSSFALALVLSCINQIVSARIIWPRGRDNEIMIGPSLLYPSSGCHSQCECNGH